MRHSQLCFGGTSSCRLKRRTWQVRNDRKRAENLECICKSTANINYKNRVQREPIRSWEVLDLSPSHFPKHYYIFLQYQFSIHGQEACEFDSNLWQEKSILHDQKTRNEVMNCFVQNPVIGNSIWIFAYANKGRINEDKNYTWKVHILLRPFDCVFREVAKSFHSRTALGYFLSEKKMRRKANAGSIFFFQFFGHDFQKLNYFSRLRFLNILRKLCVGRLKLDGTTLR